MRDKKNCIKIFFKYIILILCLLCSAINFNLLMRPVNFVTGGTPGLSLIINEIFNIPTNGFIYIIYIITFILSFIVLGKKSFFGVLIATIFYPFFVTLTSDIIKYIIIDYNDFFLLSLFSGILNGVSNGIIYKLGFPSSGLGVIGPICNKLFHLSIAKTNFIINITIVLMGGYFFGFEMVLYAIIFLYLSSYLSNKIILGISSNKVIFIRSNSIEEINKVLYDNFSLESINLKVKGGYSQNNGLMSLIVLPTHMYNMVFKQIKKIDEMAFINVLDGYELGR